MADSSITVVREQDPRTPPTPARRWPAWLVFATAWIVPATTAQRMQHTRLRAAFLVHLTAAMLTALLICLLAAWLDAGEYQTSVETMLFGWLRDVRRGFARWPEMVILVALGTIVATELAFLLLAWLVTPWGARDERIRASFAHALRQTWLQTASIFVLVLLFGLLFVLQQHAVFAWYRSPAAAQPHYPPPPLPPAKPMTATQQAEWSREYEEVYLPAVRRFEQEYRPRQPWYVRYNDQVKAVGCLGVATWFLCCLFRAVGAVRAVASPQRPPLCESCGYDLTTRPMESLCPECGRSVKDSIGEGTRPGTPWHRRRELGRWRAWWQCSYLAIVSPSSLGRQIRLTTGDTDHRWFVLPHLLLVFLIAVPTPALWMWAVLGRSASDRRWLMTHLWELLSEVGPVVGYLVAVAALLISMLAAGVVAVGYAFTDRRNLMAGTVQLACYAGGYLVLWTAGMSMGTALWVVACDWLWPRGFRLPSPFHSFPVFLLLNACFFLGFLLLIRRGTAAARYANR